MPSKSDKQYNFFKMVYAYKIKKISDKNFKNKDLLKKVKDAANKMSKKQILDFLIKEMINQYFLESDKILIYNVINEMIQLNPGMNVIAAGPLDITQLTGIYKKHFKDTENLEKDKQNIKKIILILKRITKYDGK